ncbi:nacrein-like protein [Saccostrea echinata]|uniref:nacrein-like protein n=1 Tax=Saccostrea echinata TaxID=191078 RepID=UPI002A7F622C|nr:nacrein-like protein [Saccostrea echinata]
MTVLGLLVCLCLLYVDTVVGVGYLGVKPPSQKKCHYEKIEEAHFSYERDDFCEGPYEWCNVHDCWTTCGSTERQSPINIETRKTKSLKHYRGDVKLKGCDRRVKAEIYNNGHSPHFDVKEDYQDKITLTHVPHRRHRTYNFAQLHIHVGHKKKKGSEHSINDKFYPMEAHMVFYDAEYQNVTYAKFRPEGLVVLGVMINVQKDDDDEDFEEDYEEEEEEENGHRRNHEDICDNDNDEDYERYYNRRCYKGHHRCKVRFAKTLSNIMETYYRKIKEYKGEEFETGERRTKPPCNPQKLEQDFIKSNCIKNSNDTHEKIPVCGISPLDVLPYDRRFYTYQGSLTTPPCYETVQWIVYKCPIKVTREAFIALREVEDSHHHPLSHLGVVRPLQVNKHHVFKNY